jgi:hypothetical protein
VRAPKRRSLGVRVCERKVAKGQNLFKLKSSVEYLECLDFRGGGARSERLII